jgi:hypothetical protein
MMMGYVPPSDGPSMDMLKCVKRKHLLPVTFGRDTPLRLSVAATLAVPDGPMTASGRRLTGA